MSKVKVILFWLISCTWGAIMTSIGAVVVLVLICTGHRPHRFHHLVYFEVGYGWGRSRTRRVFRGKSRRDAPAL